MKSTFSKYGCPKCGKVTKIRWLPKVDVHNRQSYGTPDELKDLRKRMPERINKPIPCHYCEAVVQLVSDETREFEDVTER